MHSRMARKGISTPTFVTSTSKPNFIRVALLQIATVQHSFFLVSTPALIPYLDTNPFFFFFFPLVADVVGIILGVFM